MAQYQGTMFFTWGSLGWSETWWAVNKPNAENALDSLNLVVLARSALLGKWAQIIQARVSNPTVRGDSLAVSYRGAAIPQLAASADAAHTGWLCRFQAGDLHRRALVLRGQPDSVFTLTSTVNPDQARPTAGFSIAFNDYVTTLRNQDWGLRHIDDANPEVRVSNITTWADGATIKYRVDMSPNPGWAPDDTVQFYGVRGDDALRLDFRGRHQVQIASIVDPGVFDLRTIGNAVSAASYQGGATGRKISYAVTEVSRGSILRIAKRDTGRPSDLPRGRRRASR